MRTRILLFVCLMFFASFYSGCKKTDDGTYVAPITLYEKLKGNWKLNETVQVDETAKITGISPSEMSLYSQLNFDSFNIALNVDGDNKPTAYKVSGEGPELFPNDGFWDLNDPFTAADGSAPIINLYSDAAKKVRTAQLSIAAVPGAKAEMELKLTRKSAGVAFVSYQYKLTNTKP